MAAEAPNHPAGYVTHAPGVGYFVQSRTTEGVWYLVHGRTCSCAAGRAERESCWHRRQVQASVSAINAEKARPVAPVNVSAMVD